MTLQQMIYFKKIAEHGSFIHAAEELYVTQPSLSHAIQLLEQELEVPLFIRQKGKRLELTAYGRQLLPHIETALHTLDTGLNDIKQLKNPDGGIVRICTAFVSPLSKTLEIMRHFSATPEGKNVFLNISVSQSGNQFLKQLQNGELDFVISGIPHAENTDSVPIFSEDIVVLMPRDHPLASYPTLTLRQLVNEPLLMYAQDMKFTLWLEALFKAQDISPNIFKFLGNWSDIMVHVLMNVGIAISPRIPMHMDSVVAVPLINPTDSHWETYLMWPTNRKLSPAAQMVKKHILNSTQISKA